MTLTKTNIPDLLILEPTVFEDERGFFYESYNLEKFKTNNLNYQFVQDNHSKSTYGVLRGLHFQLEPYAQTKLVRVTQGAVLDVAVDLRKNSPTYLQHIAIELSAENKKQLLIPRGFAHGFVVLTPTCEFLYKCDNFYNKESDGGILYNDPALNIDWKIPVEDIILSEKDKNHKTVAETDLNFYYNK